MKNRNGFIRAFWRRIEMYKDDFEKELPEKMPIQFACAFDTASILIRHEWIDINERKPDDESVVGMVAVLLEDGSLAFDSYADNYDMFASNDGKVTHWCSLPETSQL